MALTLPTTLGPYLLEAKLGQGGMAEVFRAKAFGASGFEKVVAIKTLLPELIGESSYERMFLEEAKLQAQVTHSNLVQAHDLGVVDGRVYVRLDYVDGDNLEVLHSRKRLTLGAALTVITELAKGLDALHRARDEGGQPLGLVHRDVSPSNVLISRNGEVKLGDFGIAKATLLRDITRAGIRKGTHAYMSPEQVSGRPLTAASDQFALGVVLHELVFGTRPFEGATPLLTMDLIREATPPPIKGPLKEQLLKLLAKDPSHRFASMREAFEALAPGAASVFELANQLIFRNFSADSNQPETF